MSNRVVAFADRHPWMVIWVLVVFVMIVMAASLGWVVRHETGQNKEQIAIIQQQNVAIEQAFVNGCRLAVANGRDTLLEIMSFLKDELKNRPTSIAAVVALEQIIIRKENPDISCVRPPTPPKENP